MHRQATRRRNLPAAFCLCFRRAAPPSLYTILWDQAAKFLRVRGRCQTISKGRHAIAVSALPRKCLVGSSSMRSEEHTSELQSRLHLVCRLLLEKKKHTP